MPKTCCTLFSAYATRNQTARARLHKSHVPPCINRTPPCINRPRSVRPFAPGQGSDLLKRLRTESAIERCFRASPALETSGVGTKSASECQKRAALYSVYATRDQIARVPLHNSHVPACINLTRPLAQIALLLALTALPLALTARTPCPFAPNRLPFWPWRISILLSVASVKAPPEKGLGFNS